MIAGVAHAQLQTGNLMGSVVDEEGENLPGVTITLSGQGAPQVQVTDAQGRFRFLHLGPGSYRLKAVLEGFATVRRRNISISLGRNTSIDLEMSPTAEDATPAPARASD